jgi:DNA-binding MarR family transcriptional regulator
MRRERESSIALNFGRYAVSMASTAPRIGGKAVEELGRSTGFLLALLGQDALRRLRDALTDHGLKPRQFQILDLLAERGQIGQRELGEITAIDHSILVTMLNPLEADGLVERKRSCTDRRRHEVSITPVGKRRLTGAARAQREAEDALFAGLSEQQRDQLRNLLITLRDTNHTEPADDDC